MAFVYSMVLGAVYTMLFWMPSLIKAWGVANVFTVGLLASIPPMCGIVGTVLIGRSSDRHLERRWHFVFAATLASTGLILTILLQGNLVGSLFGLCVMMTGQAALTPPFFTGISEYIPPKTAAGGIALVSSLGNLGPSVMPLLTTWITSQTGSPISSMFVVMAMFMTAGLIMALVMRPAATGQTVAA